MKIRNYRTFWVLLIITVVSIPAFNYMLYNILDNSFPKGRAKGILGSPFAFPDVWQTVSWNASMLFIIPAILIITLTSNEFTYKTHRQNIIDGWSRGRFIAVKLTGVLLFSILTTIVVLLTALAFGYIANKLPQGVSAWQESRFVLFFFVQMISYSLIAFLLSVLIKRAGLAMGVFFIYMILEQVVVLILRNKYNLTGANYFPEEVTDKLIPFPYIKSLVTGQGGADWERHIPIYLLVGALYVLIYCLLAARRFLKSDL
jgi:ABC-type transport system involved in multi-copper enzyme maturation permease subunit